MAQRIGSSTITFDQSPRVAGFAGVAGKKEGQGPLAHSFDKINQDPLLGQSSFEKAESALQKQAVELALNKAGLTPEQVRYIFAGDLLNQCIGSSFGLREFGIPFIGLFGACSTMALSLIMASLSIESGAADCAAAVTSSHFCSAERQFRFPLEYGGQRTPTAQWTVTGAGAAILKADGNGPVIRAAAIGEIVDLGVKDANNMGAAMAPAAAKTIAGFLRDTGTKPNDYDLILTGDLGKVGTQLLYQLLGKDGIDIAARHNDCGLMIFDLKKQDVHAGGSGCGCSASVFCSEILSKMQKGAYRNILFCATGALMSTTSSQQGESIPGIAHLVQICA